MEAEVPKILHLVLPAPAPGAGAVAATQPEPEPEPDWADQCKGGPRSL